MFQAVALPGQAAWVPMCTKKPTCRLLEDWGRSVPKVLQVGTVAWTVCVGGVGECVGGWL